MDTNKHELFLKDEVFQIINCAYEVSNVIGHGLLEKPYENALIVEFELRNVPFRQQQKYTIIYKDKMIGEYIPDLIVYDQIVIDIKVIDRIGNHERGQMMNYLKITRHKVGIIINFKNAKVEWERIVL